MRIRLPLLSLGTILFFLVQQAECASLIFRENFETPDVSSYPNTNGNWLNFGINTPGMTGSNASRGPSFVGDSGLIWTVDIGNIDITAEWQASSGNQSIDLNGWEPGTLFTQLFLQRGNYLLKFALSKHPGLAGAPAAIDLSIGGLSVFGSPFTTYVESSSNDMLWNIVTVPFTVDDAGTHELRFTSLVHLPWPARTFGPAIDDVSLYLVPVSSIVGSHIIHTNWTGPGSPIDTQMVLAEEGLGLRLLSESNFINSSHGLTGLAFDIQNLASSSDPTADDFVFQMSPQGSFSEILNPAQSWPLAPAPSSVSTSALSEPDNVSRISIEWANNQIENRWLRITVKANENTGLMQPHLYYIGHLRGETTGADGASYTVSFSDIIAIRQAVGTQADAGSTVDIDKNGIVSFSDISAMRNNVGTVLTNITVP
jgi:hypothetical protein